MSDVTFPKHGGLRPFFRCLLSVVGIFTVAMTVVFVAGSMPVPFEWLPRGLALLFWYNLLLLPILLALYTILARLLEQRPLGSVGLAFHPRWKNELMIGLLAGAAMILMVAGSERLLGVAHFSLSPIPPGRVALAGAFFLLFFIVAAASEELIFRGYPFQRLIEAAGAVLAVFVSSFLFGFAHWGNPFHSWVSTVNTMLVGVLLGICYLRTRALWLPLGIHFAWNFVQGYVLGFPVSGVPIPQPLLQAKVLGPLWLTGGAYGPEGSILTLGVIAAGTVYFFVSRRIFITREMRDLVLGLRGGKGTESALFSRDFVPTEKRW